MKLIRSTICLLSVMAGIFLFGRFASAGITYVGTASASTNNTAVMQVDVSGIGIQADDLIIFFVVKP